MTEPRVALHGIRKAFAGIPVLRGIDLTIAPGEVLGLVGENGAGKSTLMKVLGGVYPHPEYGGDIFILGRSCRLHRIPDGEAARSAVIY